MMSHTLDQGLQLEFGLEWFVIKSLQLTHVRKLKVRQLANFRHTLHDIFCITYVTEQSYFKPKYDVFRNHNCFTTLFTVQKSLYVIKCASFWESLTGHCILCFMLTRGKRPSRDKTDYCLQSVFWGPYFPLRTTCLFSWNYYLINIVNIKMSSPNLRRGAGSENVLPSLIINR